MPGKDKFEVSQFVSYPLFLAKEELEELFPDGVFVCLGKILQNPIISKKEFIAMAVGERMNMVGFALNLDHFTFMEISGTGVIAKACLPVVEISSFAFMITSQGKLLEQTGKDCLFFGLCISYPMLFSISDVIEKTREKFLEATIFHGMRGWIRKETKLGEFTFEEKVVKSSVRIGKKAFDEARKKSTKIKGLELHL